jgi:antitoxin VapB
MHTASIFSNNRSQAVRLPADLRLPQGVKQVRIRAVGADRILSPLTQTWDSFFLNQDPAPADFLPVRADQTQSEREAF